MPKRKENVLKSQILPVGLSPVAEVPEGRVTDPAVRVTVRQAAVHHIRAAISLEVPDVEQTA